MKLPRTPTFRLDGKQALVTGASSGIGLGCAVALAEAGAHVVCAARGAERLQDAVSAMVAEGWSAEALPLDIADLDALTAAMRGQGFDIVVNSAGLARHSAALETTPEDYDAVMNINLRAAYFLSVEAARGMIAKGKGGSIIHISSQMGHVGGIERAVYCASKHGLEGMVKAMAIEWGPDQDPDQHDLPDVHQDPAYCRDLRQPRARRLDRGKDQTGACGRGRGYHGRGGLPCL